MRIWCQIDHTKCAGSRDDTKCFGDKTERNALSFALVLAVNVKGDRTVRLEFPMPLENRVGWGLTGLSVIALAVLAIRKER